MNDHLIDAPVSPIAQSEEPAKFYSTHDYVGPGDTLQKNCCELIRAKCKELETLIATMPGFQTHEFATRCFAEAMSALEIVNFYTVKGIMFNNKPIGISIPNGE